MNQVCDKWLEWDLRLYRENNKIAISLIECIRHKDEMFPCVVNRIGFVMVKIRFWDDEISISRKLNRVQEEMLRRYASNYRFWNKLETNVLSGFKGGKIILNDIETYEFIKKQAEETKKKGLRVIK